MAANGLNLLPLIAGVSNAQVSGATVTMSLSSSDGTPYEATVPAEVLSALADVLSVLEAGSSAVVVNGHRDLTTTQAAEILSMSRTSLRAVIDSGELAAHKRGTHFRLRLTDVLEFRRRAEFEAQTGEAYALLDRADAVTPKPRETPAHVLNYRRRLAREQRATEAAAAAADGGAE
jgi:excisionase family DNA binding protein